MYSFASSKQKQLVLGQNTYQIRSDGLLGGRMGWVRAFFLSFFVFAWCEIRKILFDWSAHSPDMNLHADRFWYTKKFLMQHYVNFTTWTKSAHMNTILSFFVYILYLLCVARLLCFFFPEQPLERIKNFLIF